MNRKGIVPIVALMWIVGILTVGVVAWFTGPSIVKAVKGENTNQSR